MQKINWECTQFVIAGLGKTGLSCARYLQNKGAKFKLWDTRTSLKLDKELEASGRVHLGTPPSTYWNNVDFLVVSPGIAIDLPEVLDAKQQGVTVIGDIELFAREVSVPVLGVTGSNGKTTVTLLTAHILKSLGINAIAAGNVGLPALDALDQKPDVVVLELSSFQLDTTHTLALLGGTILNVSADHLDRHHTFEAYLAAKRKIYQHCEHVVSNREDNNTLPLHTNQRYLDFGLTVSKTGFGWNPGEQTVTYNGESLLKLGETALVGLHNALNIQASLALVSLCVDEIQLAAEQVKSFDPAPHRCAPVGTVAGVTFIDDSKATNIGATEAALTGLAPNLAGRLILIAGGDAKGADLSALQPVLDKFVDVVIALGKDGEVLSRIAHHGYYVPTMEKAVQLAFEQARNGDTVLMSPACASLDMFVNYEHRALAFCTAVRGLAA